MVIGDFMLDRYLWGKTDRISPESPVPVVHVQSETETLGGAGNVVANICGLGLSAIPIGIIGKDGSGEKLKNRLSNLGCDTDGLLTTQNRPTIEKTRVIAQNQQVVRIDYEEKEILPKELVQQIKTKINKYLKEVSVIVISDYGKGICSEEIVQFIISKVDGTGKKVVVDPKGNNYSKYKGAYCITPNKKEAFEATGIEIADTKTAGQSGKFISSEYDISNVLITRGKDGMTLIEPEDTTHLGTKAQDVFDVSGAGDTVISTLASSLAIGLDLRTAMNFANSAAGVVVSRVGTAPINLGELKNFIKSNGNSRAHNKIVDEDEMTRKVSSWKTQGYSIVFTNGCFDILHTGHISLFEQAKSYGDKLIVGLNSDDSIRRLKGENRPVLDESTRAQVLAAVEFIDLIILFDEDTPQKLIASIKPDYLVKGADYIEEEIVGGNIVKSYGGEIVRVQIVENQSTTNIVNSILQGNNL